MEATMRETLVTVQKAAEEKREAAHKEADIILKEAEVRAGNWIEDAHRSIREVKKELARLRSMRESYVSRLKMLIQAQLDMLKVAEMDDEAPEESLDMFEEQLEALTARARQRVSEAGAGPPTPAVGGGVDVPAVEADDQVGLVEDEVAEEPIGPMEGPDGLERDQGETG
jgi:cell division septum initiation protein DivIVA